jgi:hypothetical protein
MKVELHMIIINQLLWLCIVIFVYGLKGKL